MNEAKEKEINKILINEKNKYDGLNEKFLLLNKILKAKRILEENGLHNIEIIKSLNELEENQKIQVNQELLDNMKQKRLYQEEEINKIFKKS